MTPHGDPDAHAPRSFRESRALWAGAKTRPKVERMNTVYWVTADVWDVDTGAGTFRVAADVSKGLAAYGEGIYELAVFALVGGKSVRVCLPSRHPGVAWQMRDNWHWLVNGRLRFLAGPRNGWGVGMRAGEAS